MNPILVHLKPWAPAIGTVLGFLFALVIAVRYKLPDLTKRVEAMEKSDKQKTTSKDITQALDGFKTICQFNQATCKIENEHKWNQIRNEIDNKLSALYEKLNDLATSNAELVAKVEILLKDRDRKKQEG